jgi:hypothetical protein
MRMIGFAALAAVLGNVPGAALPAQDVPDRTEIVAEAVTELLHMLRSSDGVPEGTIRYDARPVETRLSDLPAYPEPVAVYLLAEPDTAAALAIQAAMGAEAGNLEDARVCANESPRSCRLRDAVAVFAAGAPVVVGDSAQVMVKALWMGNLAKQPVQAGVFRINLRREGEGWRIARAETVFIS